MKRLLLATCLVGGMALTLPSQATAALITIGPDCDTCGDHNTTFGIDVTLIDAALSIYDVTVTATYGTPLDYSYITAIGIKFADAGLEDFISVTGPDGGTWSLIEGSLSNGKSPGATGEGCAANPGEAWACTDDDPGATPPGPDTWVLRLNLSNALNLSNLEGSFKARFEDSEGEFVGPLLSEGFGPPTTVPEPASLTMLAIGFAAVAARGRRRRQA